MRQLRWGLKAEFPYTKVFFLGVLLTALGSACVVVSVVGIVQLAWGYYVCTGMWGGVTITVSGLAAMYAARAQSSLSARLYFFLSVVTCLVSFAMVVLSAGGLTYSSKFYQPMRFDSSRHKVTLFLHGSVLGVGVVSLACNLLSVIVCCKFITKEKSRGEETFKLRRYRHRFSDVNSAHRGSSRGSQATVRTSTNSRTPLFGSERSHKHSRRTSESDSTNLKIPGERVSNRRDSDRSKGSSRSRHSHHRQSSSVSQQSRQSAPMDAEVTTVLLRDTDHNHMEITSSHSTIDNARDSQAETMTDNMSVQLVFDPDEEPPPPYEEARPITLISSDGNESDTEAVEDSSNVVIPSCLPLNIPVMRIRACQMQSLQSQPPPMEPSSNQMCEHPQQNSEQCSSEAAGASMRAMTDTHKADVSNTERDNRINMTRMTLAEQWPSAAASAAHSSPLQDGDSSNVLHSEDGSASPEICALTGERMTPVAAEQPDSVAAGDSAALVSCVSKHIPSPDSSDSSLPGELVTVGHNPAPSHPPSGTAYAVISESSSALPAGIHSPSSAFRPVGKRVVPLAHASPSNSVPLHNVFSPISSPASAHHTVYSPIASPSSAARFASPTSPHRTKNMASSSSESLSRGGCVQSLSWKKIPLPPSHNHSNRTSSVPFKEVVSKTIPGPSQPPPRERDNTLPHSLPKRASKDKERGFSKSSENKALRSHAGNGLESDGLHKQESKFSSPVRRFPQKAQPAADQGPRSAEDSHVTEQNSRSAFVSKQPGNAGRPPISASTYPAPTGKQVPVSVVSSHPAVGKQVPVSVVESHPAGRNKHSNGNNGHSSNARGQCNKASAQPVSAFGSNHSAAVVNFPPANTQPSGMGSQHMPATNKQSAVHASPSKVVRDPTAGMDSNCRSTGCQATDDGGIASSMDRTHRWVMGTLPSGTRFQGTTKNTILIHGNSRNSTLTQGARNNPLIIHAAARNPAHAQGGTRTAAFPQGSTRNSTVTQSPTRNPVMGVNSSPERSALLAPVARHGGGKGHSVWNRPNKTAPNPAGGDSAAAMSSAPVSASASSAVTGSSSSSSAFTPLSAPAVNAPLPSASAFAPLSAPAVNAPLPSSSAFAPLSAPAANASSSSSSSTAFAPLSSPAFNTPFPSSSAFAPLSSPAVKAPFSSSSAFAPLSSPSVTNSLSSSSAFASVSSSSLAPFSCPSVAAAVSSPPVKASPFHPSVSASSASASEPVAMQSSAPADPGGGGPSTRLPRYHHATRHAEGPCLMQPLQPVPVLQPRRPQPMHRSQPAVSHQLQHPLRPLADGDQDLEQQQGKPLFSVLL
ncbi:hypothetical protein ACOMHN_050604 [Nucella lapillus]